MILSGQRLETLECRGVLIIGDPHVSSRRPGRRKDEVWPKPVLTKLERCVVIANERDLIPVILGDLFDRPVEPDESLKTQLIRILKSFRHRPLVNVGNHDIQHTTLSDGDTLALLGLCDVVDVVPSSGPVIDLQINGSRLGIGMTPYGQVIPQDVRGSFSNIDRQVWFTHHDIAFDGGYPGAVPPFAVEGCDLLINGHIHKTQKGIVAGRTHWMKPGNITRQSVDLLDHLPRAWILDASGTLLAQDLPYEADIFDLTGRVVEAASGQAVAEALESAFVSLLSAEASTELRRSDDGSILRDEIEAKFASDETPDAIKAIVRSLLGEAVALRRRTGVSGRMGRLMSTAINPSQASARTAATPSRLFMAPDAQSTSRMVPHSSSWWRILTLSPAVTNVRLHAMIRRTVDRRGSARMLCSVSMV
jgi:hypothetical protein